MVMGLHLPYLLLAIMHVNLPVNKILLVLSNTKGQIRLCQTEKKSLQDPSCQITNPCEFCPCF
ncbi:hypothetical protein GLYMA_13G316300v4 [Glycine max]|uniref:Uncharacterized protein n=1 Tax=Glycine max TaxID=3847 RepID=A0A0R0H3Q6_SOYBN|nr:hypothetical protein GYH30_037977 [Glycine max]KRH22674.1 hypothetical protein GLYMA_13G316300v4 [Glycine max]